LDSIRVTIERLVEMPSMGRSRDWLKPGQLAFASGRYLIVYRVSGELIQLAHVSGADCDLRETHE
jgi:plasmid stabilization system protein ParE